MHLGTQYLVHKLKRNNLLLLGGIPRMDLHMVQCVCENSEAGSKQAASKNTKEESYSSSLRPDNTIEAH